MLACARLGAIHSVVFGGFAAASLATRIDDARPSVLVTADAGMRAGKVIAYKPLVDEALAHRAPSAAQGDPRRPRARPRIRADGGPRPRLRALARRARGRARAVRVARIVGAVVHPVHVGNDRPAEGRAARHRRLRGRARVVDAPHLLPRARRDDVHDERHRLGRRPFVHRLRAADQRLADDHVRGPADPARSRHLVEDRRGAPRQDDVQLADGHPRAEEAGRVVHAPARPRRRSPTCSSPASRSTSRRRAGRAKRSGSRSSTTTGRPNRVGRSSPRNRASRKRRASSARRRSRLRLRRASSSTPPRAPTSRRGKRAC